MIKAIYLDQQAAIWINSDLTENFKVEKGTSLSVFSIAFYISSSCSKVRKMKKLKD